MEKTELYKLLQQIGALRSDDEEIDDPRSPNILQDIGILPTPNIEELKQQRDLSKLTNKVDNYSNSIETDDTLSNSKLAAQEALTKLKLQQRQKGLDSLSGKKKHK